MFELSKFKINLNFELLVKSDNRGNRIRLLYSKIYLEIST